MVDRSHIALCVGIEPIARLCPLTFVLSLTGGEDKGEGDAKRMTSITYAKLNSYVDLRIIRP
jgi:hypothetical protein